MKPLMLRHKHDWLPKKLKYNTPYYVAFIAVSHEGFEFVLKPKSKVVKVTDDKGTYVWSKKQLKEYFQLGLLQFCAELEELTYEN